MSREEGKTAAILVDGFATGLILQIAVGPVFFFIVNIALTRTTLDGWLAVSAATLVDYLFITLAVLGVGRLLERPTAKRTLGIGSALVLIGFGALMIGSTPPASPLGSPAHSGEPAYVSSFVSTVVLTISSPLTIVFWTGLFAAKAVERGYAPRQLVIFGVAAGMATLIFLGASVTLLSAIRTAVPAAFFAIGNSAVGLVLMAYGGLRLGKLLRRGRVESNPPAPPAG